MESAHGVPPKGLGRIVGREYIRKFAAAEERGA
jgi:hypothetical protein